MEDKTQLLTEYYNIYESCKLISKNLDDNALEGAQNTFKTCEENVRKLIETESFSCTASYTSTLLCVQEELKRQSRQIRTIIGKKSDTDDKVASIELLTRPLDEIGGLLENCEIDVTSHGFDTIAGLQSVKASLISCVVLPFMQPQLYDGLKLRNCILLFGPPGTGKTKLAMATAAEVKAKFISITSSSVLSHYVGKSEKIISGIFHHVKTSETPTILFIDEIDAFCRSRTEDEPDYTRRIKTEILCQITNFDGVSNGYLICATNCPWQLDVAFKRRFQRQLYVPLPDDIDRYHLLKMYTRGTPLENMEDLWRSVVPKTQGYSGSDIEHLIMQALIKPVERLQHVNLWHITADGGCKPFLQNQTNDLMELKVCKVQELPAKSIKRPEVNAIDVLQALDESRPTVGPDDIKKFESYNQ